MEQGTGQIASDETSGRRKGEQTAERILDAAEALFAARGYAATTLRDVASAVGLRNPSLYNHFASKEALYAAVLERGIRPVFETLMRSVMHEAQAEAQARLLEEVMALLARRPALARLVQHEALAGGEHLTPMLHEWIRPVFAQARALIEAQGRTGRWRPEQVPHLILAMYQVTVGYFTIAPLYRELSGEDLLSQRALAEQTRFLVQLVTVLFPSADPDPDDGGPVT
jgi:TetR/AcrR family transcriptional regulator